MGSVARDKVKEFGTPDAYRQNRLYNVFCEYGKEDLYYSLVYYGLGQEEDIDVPFGMRYRQLLHRVIKYQQRRMANICKFIRSRKAPGLWLDIGCGVGQFMNYIVQLNGNRAIGTEISFVTLKKASCLLKKLSNNRRYCLVNQDSLELPFKAGSFDYVLSADVLEHVGYDNQEKILCEIHRVLRKNGQAIVHTPNLKRVIITRFVKRMYYLFKGINPLNITHAFPKSHISITTSSRLEKISQSIGFDTEVYRQISCKGDAFFKLAFLGLDSLFSRSFILVLSKRD